MQRRRRINPKDDARFYVTAESDKVGLDIKYINAVKGRGIFTSVPFEKGDFLLEYRGDLISNEECERRQIIYHDLLKLFMFEFHFNGKLWCVDAATENGSLGRLVNDDHINPNAKMKYLTVQGKPHLCLFAVRDISPGEEITYNYGDSDWPWRCKALDDEMAPKICGATNPPSTVDDTEELTTESKCIHTAISHPNQTSPELGPLTKVGEALDDEMAPKICGATNPPSTVDDTEELTTESKCIHTAISHPNQTSPELGPLTKCQKHRLVCATVSSLDKCVNCVGPVSSFKWLGYRCTDEIALSDAEDSGSKSDNSNTEVTTSEFGTVDFDSTTTEQDHDIGGFGSVSFVSSTVNECVPPSEGNYADEEHGSRRVAKKVWSKAEVAAVMRHFKDHISRGKLATKTECSHCKLVEDPALAQRTVQNIRDFVRNRGITAKRQSQKEKV
ncbi:uncharacterized protein LOC144513205 isoform X3 [Sander vitreus]